MIQVIPVRRTYLSIACDWPGCEGRVDFPEGPDDEDRNTTLLNAAHALARRLGWEVTDGMDGEVVCPNHPREASWPSSSSPTPTGRNTNEHMPIH